MTLFENEHINITNICHINKYVTTDSQIRKNRFLKYSTDLRKYELIFFISGESETEFSNVNIKDQKNSLRYLPKGNFPGEYIVNRKAPGECIDIFFDTDIEMPKTAGTFENSEYLKDKFIKIFNIWTERKPNYYIKAMRVFYDIILDIKLHFKNTPKNSYPALNNVDAYISENFKQCNFDYNALCNVSGLSYSYFSEIFIKKYNMSPVKYITKLKIDYAKELLITNLYTVSEVAQMCGFENVYYFSNVFKKITGISPSKF